jgi:hypothetical protein
MIIKTRVNGKTMLKVVRPPRLKAIRAHLFGLTLGLTTLLAHLIFATPAQRTLALALLWLVIGYAAGAIFCLLYNAFAYLYLKLIHPEWLHLWFWYAPHKIVNVIKTPIPGRDWDSFTRILYEKEPYKVFNYCFYDNVKDPVTGKKMENPYTIVFVVNPYIRKRQKRNGQVMAMRDPITANVSIFLKAVYRALFSFEFNEVIGRPDIFGKIRVVTVNETCNEKIRPGMEVRYENVKDQCYVREFLGKFEVDPERNASDFDNAGDINTFANRILVPEISARAKIAKLVKEQTGIQHIDVIFAISASPTHDMSSSRVATNDWRMNNPQDGKYFTYSSDPYCEKGDEILKNDCEKKLCEGYATVKLQQQGDCLVSPPLHRPNGPDRALLHEYFPDPNGMGLVAMSAYDVRTKLPLHEFAHAMSSMGHGMIVDEYYDFAVIEEEETVTVADEPVAPPGLEVNRIFRNPAVMKGTHEISVHKHFARYNGYVYESDRDHHIAQQGWYSYFPSRKNPEVRCIMEAAEDVFQYDELLTDFIYDRLWAKVNRDFLIP